jgi:DNA-binding response OmpR family regulator
MQSEHASTHDSRTLLVDANLEHGRQLSEHLNHAGFRTDLAVSWRAAHAALGTNYYHSCVMSLNLDQPVDLEHFDALRRAAQRVWMIILSDRQPEQAQDLAYRHSVDALLSAPFSMHDLTSRLSAFSLRARLVS